MSLLELKKEVIKAFIAHETGGELKYTNSEYDEMLAKVKEQDPYFNEFDYLPRVEGNESIKHRPGIPVLEKYSPKDNEIRQYWIKEEGKVKYPKYDGSSLVIYYTDGKLSHIASMGDKYSGVDQTEKFSRFVPPTVDPKVSFIRCECLVDPRKYENARGKANGLVNSKYLQEEVDKLAFLIGYQVIDLNGKLIPRSEWNVLNLIVVAGLGVKFLMSPEVQDITLLPERGYARIDKYDLEFCIDGIVYAEDDNWGVPWAYKYDYLNTAKTTVDYISWRETNHGGYTPVLEIDPVTLESKTISNVSTNGVRKFLDLGCGIGSEIEVAFSGMTIPKVIRVIKEAPTELCKCSHCSTQLTKDYIFGNQVKCHNLDCKGKIEYQTKWYDNYVASMNKEEIKKDIESLVFWLLNLSNFSYSSKRVVAAPVITQKMLEYIESQDVDKFNDLIWNSYNMTETRWDEMVLNSKATIKVIHDKLFI